MIHEVVQMNNDLIKICRYYKVKISDIKSRKKDNKYNTIRIIFYMFCEKKYLKDYNQKSELFNDIATVIKRDRNTPRFHLEKKLSEKEKSFFENQLNKLYQNIKL